MKLRFLVLMLFSSLSLAAPITYEGELLSGNTYTGSVADPFETASDWWFFNATAGDSITIRVDRLDYNLDPALNLYAGLQTDTSSLSSRIAFADDNIPHPGPFGDPLLNFNITTTGVYSVAVWDFLSGRGAPFDYQISLTGATSVSEPASLALLALGLAGLGFARRKAA